MFFNNTPIDEANLPDEFASFFSNKVQTIVREQSISNNVYNGTQKMVTQSSNFMLESDVLIAMKTLNIKNCEGHDRIPLKILNDGTQFLLKPLSILFMNSG